MSIFAGVWMDNQKAVTVILVKESVDLSIIKSRAESPSKTIEEQRLATPYAQRLLAENLQKTVNGADNDFFDKIYRRVKTADELVLVGPDDAKKQFINFLMQQRSPMKVRGCVPVGFMSNSEIAQHVCRVFNHSYY